jgi:hypothetical protein
MAVARVLPCRVSEDLRAARHGVPGTVSRLAGAGTSHRRTPFIGAFAKSRNATVSFIKI